MVMFLMKKIIMKELKLRKQEYKDLNRFNFIIIVKEFTKNYHLNEHSYDIMKLFS